MIKPMLRIVPRPPGSLYKVLPKRKGPVPTPPKTIPLSARLKQRAIVFVGPMAAGKTSAGKRVAKALGIPFIDTDAQIVRTIGCSIAQFFERHGEREFRKIEAEIVEREISEPGVRVVALGGGAILSPETRLLLRKHPVILLMTTQEAVLRTANLDKRPLLRDDPEEWGRILEQRKPLYESIADITFHTNRTTYDELTKLIVEWVTTNTGRGAK